MIDKHHQEEDEHNQHVKREKADRKDGVKRRPKPRCSGYNSGSKPVEIDGFRKVKQHSRRRHVQMRDMGTIELINGQANRGRHPNLRQKEKARSKRASNDEGTRATIRKNRKVEFNTY